MAHTPETELGIDTGAKLGSIGETDPGVTTGAKLGSIGETDPGIDTGAVLTQVMGEDIDTGTVITAEAEIGLLPAN